MESAVLAGLAVDMATAGGLLVTAYLALSGILFQTRVTQWSSIRRSTLGALLATRWQKQDVSNSDEARAEQDAIALVTEHRAWERLQDELARLDGQQNPLEPYVQRVHPTARELFDYIEDVRVRTVERQATGEASPIEVSTAARANSFRLHLASVLQVLHQDIEDFEPTFRAWRRIESNVTIVQLGLAYVLVCVAIAIVASMNSPEWVGKGYRDNVDTVNLILVTALGLALAAGAAAFGHLVCQVIHSARAGPG